MQPSDPSTLSPKSENHISVEGSSPDPKQEGNPATVDFLWRLHQHIQETIRFVDSKAAGVFAVTSVLLVTLCSHFRDGQPTWPWLLFLWLALISLVFSLICAIMLLMPRTPSGSQPTVMSPKYLASDYSDPEKLLFSLDKSTAIDYSRHLVNQIVVIVSILATKLLWTRIALYSLLLGILFAIPPLVHKSGPSTTRLDTDSPRSVTVAQFGDLLLYLPLYIAKEEGLFAKRGLDVRIISTSGDDKTYAAVASGQASFGIADPTFAAIANSQGHRARVIGLLVDGVPNYAVSLGSLLPIQNLETLKGISIATPPSPSTAFALTKDLYEKAKLPPSIRQVSPAALMATLQAKDADLAVLIEPWVSTTIRNGGSVVIEFPRFYKSFALTGITCTERFATQEADTCSAFLAAMQEAAIIFYSDEAKTLKVAQKMFPNEDVADLQSGIHRHRSDRIHPSSLEVPLESWKIAIDLRVRSGDLPARADDYRSVLK